MFSDDYGQIIRRNNYVYPILGTCCSVWVNGMQGGTNVQPCIPDSHPHRTTTKCRVNIVVSPDDWPIVARNM